MKFVVILLLFVFTIFVNAIVYNESTDACTFTANEGLLPSRIRACFNLIPLDENIRTETLKQVRLALEFHTYSDIVSSQTGLNFEEELEKLAKKKYTNEFEFHADIATLLQYFLDSGSYYIPPAGYDLKGRLPFVLTASGSLRNIIVKKNSRYSFPVPSELYGKRLVSVNGIPTVTFVKNLLFFPTVDDSSKLNRVLFGLQSFYLSTSHLPEEDKSTWTFADGTSYDFPNDFYSVINITNLADLKKKNGVESAQNKRCDLDLQDPPSEALKNFISKKSESGSKRNDYDEGELVCTFLTSFNDSEIVIRGLVECGRERTKVPYLIISSFPNNFLSFIPFKKAVLDFVNDIASTKSPIAFIDVSGTIDTSDTDPANANPCIAEWTVNVLSGLYSQPYEYDSSTESRSFRVLFDQRITSDDAKFFFTLQATNFINPANGLQFDDSTCLVNNPVPVSPNRYKKVTIEKEYEKPKEQEKQKPQEKEKEHEKPKEQEKGYVKELSKEKVKEHTTEKEYGKEKPKIQEHAKEHTKEKEHEKVKQFNDEKENYGEQENYEEQENFDVEYSRKRSEPKRHKVNHHYKQKTEELTKKFYLPSCDDFLKLPSFSTKYLISTSGFRCAGVCGIVTTALKRLNKAKIFGVGGSKRVFSTGSSFSGLNLDWSTNVAPLFPLDSQVSPLPTSASLRIPFLEAYFSDLEAPELTKSLKVDDVIGWQEICPTSPNSPSQYFSYMFSHAEDHSSPSPVLPTFKAEGKCYQKEKHVYEYH